MVNSVKKAFDILEAIASTDNQGRLFEISKKLNLKPPAVHNLLKTLVNLGYVTREGETYKITPRIFEQFMPAFKENMLGRIAEPVMQGLCQKIGEYVVLVVNKDNTRHVVAQVSYNNDVIVNPTAMDHPVLYGTSTGRLMLSQLDDKALEQYVKKNGLPNGEWEGVSSMTALKKEIVRIRKQGIAVYALSKNQVKSFAVPVTDPDNRVIGVLGTYLPVQRLKQKKESFILGSLKDACAEISHRIGFKISREEA
jgi:IclR family pca regulon transcriptional regulator